MSVTYDELVEICAEYGVPLDSKKELSHYGMPRRSGRYPWGSGEDPYQSLDFMRRAKRIAKGEKLTGEDFVKEVSRLRGEGVTSYKDPKTGKEYKGDAAIAKRMGYSINDFRSELSITETDARRDIYMRVKSLKDDGMSNADIVRKMGFKKESSVRSLLDAESVGRMNRARQTAEILMKRIDETGQDVLIGKGLEKELGISKQMLDTAVYVMERDFGYHNYAVRVPQPLNPKNQTTVVIASSPDKTYRDAYKSVEAGTVTSVIPYTSNDGGKTFHGFRYPASVDKSRVGIRYADEGGLPYDGLIEIRPGVKDLSLGDARYCQVRILVNGTHYLKGMAVYAHDTSDWPEGQDIRFNTNKTSNKTPEEVLKPIKKDPDNPFGAYIEPKGQSTYIDKDGKEQLSAINKTREQGQWDDWSNSVPSQFLSKQPIALAQRQLGIAKQDKLDEFNEIKSLTNPVVKRYYLEKFAQGCDSAAVSLKAAAFPGQGYKVMIPMNWLKDNEVYAPAYEDGTILAMVRYPHGGQFEIPIVKVNNKNPTSAAMIGKNAIDAVGMNAHNAGILSGADYDGDTVMCIPTKTKNGIDIQNKKPYEKLANFDPKAEYGTREVIRKEIVNGVEKDVAHYYDDNGLEVKVMKNKGTQMGIITNLITDMTLSGNYTDDEIVRAVRHSMVVIDAEKHHLDYLKSEKDNRIGELKRKYQRRINPETGEIEYGKGASTIISRASHEVDIAKRRGQPKIDPETGENIYKTVEPTGYFKREKDENGQWHDVLKKNRKTGEMERIYVPFTQKSTAMMEAKDAMDLVSEAKHPIELVYADYANSMKQLANQARLEILATKNHEVEKSAKLTYSEEIKSLNEKLDFAESNAQREKLAQIQAYSAKKAKQAAADKLYEETGEKTKAKDITKAAQMALNKYREEYGSVKRSERKIDITDREWEAIQNHAISSDKVRRILANTDPDNLRARALPGKTQDISKATQSRIRSLAARKTSTGEQRYTLADIAAELGVSVSTVQKYMKQ